MRKEHINFIKEDTKQRGETITSEILFFAAIYECRVRKDGQKHSKTVTYSAAENVLYGYRKISVT